MNITKRTIDNSYVIEKNGMPYHVPNEGEFVEEWAEVNAYAEAHPEEVELEYPPQSYTPTEEEIFIAAVAEKRAKIWGAGDAILAAVKANFTEAEIESWSKQEQGAKDLIAGNNDTEAALFVIAIATQRGIEPLTLAEKIMGNVASYGALSAKVIGEQQRLDDLIKLAEANQDKEALEAIVWTYNPLTETTV